MAVNEQDAHVRFVNVQKSYDGENLVVKDFNLDVESGEFLTMLGPSGSGKTTCLMMLAGFETATSGQIILDGDSINNVPPWKREIGMVFQNYALFPHLTVGENLAYPLQVRNMSQSEIEERVNRALNMVQMPEFAGRRPTQLSGGQQQRVAVARAVVSRPTLVLADEPTANLDPLSADTLYRTIRSRADEGLAVVVVTHDLHAVEQVCDRVAVIQGGVKHSEALPGEKHVPDASGLLAVYKAHVDEEGT